MHSQAIVVRTDYSVSAALPHLFLVVANGRWNQPFFTQASRKTSNIVDRIVEALPPIYERISRAR